MVVKSTLAKSRSAGSLYFGSGRVFLFLILWIIPHAGDDMLGGNVGTTGTFFLVVMTCGAILAILFVYIILLVFSNLTWSKDNTSSRKR